MKGLLTKDFALLRQNFRILIILVVWAIAMCFTNDDAGFVVSWLSIISCTLSISSIAYDEHDNCMPFLLTLPADLKAYVAEKYLLSAITGICGLVLALSVFFASCAVKGITADTVGKVSETLVFIPFIFLMPDICIPINLKFGTEKGRLILIVCCCAFIGVITAMSRLSGINAYISAPRNVSAYLVPAVSIVTLALTALSMFLSMAIMKKKEF